MGDREARTRTARGQFYSLRCASELSAARGRPRLTGSRVAHIFVRGVRGRGRGNRRLRGGRAPAGARALRLRLTAPISQRRERRHATSFRPVVARACDVVARPSVPRSDKLRTYALHLPLPFSLSLIVTSDGEAKRSDAMRRDAQINVRSARDAYVRTHAERVAMKRRALDSTIES